MTVPRLTYADGYQAAMHELTAILTQDGIDAMLVYLANNTVD